MIKITKNNFAETIKKDKVVIDFYADWCGPCKMLEPIFLQVASELSTTIFAKLDVDQERELAKQHNVSSIPTIIVFENGKEVNRINGFVSKEKLVAFIENKKK